MSWSAIGAAAVGGVATAYAGAQQQKASQKQTEAQLQLSQEQLAQQKELAMQQFAKELGILSGTQAGQEEALQRATKIGEQAQQQFMAATEDRPEQITRLQEIIRQQRLPEQQQAIKRGQLALQRAGVRGPEAGQQTQMLIGRLGRELGFDVEKLALEEAMRRQRSREQFAGAQALAAQAAALRPVQKVDETKIQKRIDTLKGNIATDAEKKALQSFYSAQGTLGGKDFSNDYYLTSDDKMHLDYLKKEGKYGL
jgi:hypothetical protein